MLGRDEIERRFAYHPPMSTKARAGHEAIRQRCVGFADFLDELLPDGREKSLAITSLELAMMWANAAHARPPAQRREPQ